MNGTEAYALAGAEQFGLGENVDFANWDGTTYTPAAAGSYYAAHPLDNTASTGYLTEFDANQSGSDVWQLPGLDGMTPETHYGDANGALVSPGDGTTGPEFDFSSDTGALTTPVPIATKNSGVVRCSTGQVRYVADIAPYTAAGIYTTKMNFLAAPEY